MVKNTKGFTIIEVLIVIVIVGILSNMAIVNFGNKSEEAKNVVSQANTLNIMTALELYEMDKGYYPDDSSENPLYILLGGEGERGYLKMKEELLDGYDYVLSVDKKSYTISIREI